MAEASNACSLCIASKFSKVMLGSDHEEFGFGEHFTQEWILCLQALAQFRLGVDRRVNFALQGLLCWIKRLHDICEAGVADQHQIDVAAGCFLATRERAKDKSQLNLPGQREQRIRQHIHQAGGLAEQAGQFGKDPGKVGMEFRPDSLKKLLFQ